MYNLPYFKENDPQVVLQFMREHPFAVLSGCSAANKPVATQVPLLIEERDGKLFLQGHIMRQTDHHKAFESNPEVLPLLLQLFNDGMKAMLIAVLAQFKNIVDLVHFYFKTNNGFYEPAGVFAR